MRRPLAEPEPRGCRRNSARVLLQFFGIAPGQPGVHLVTSPNYHTAVTLFSGSSLHMGHTLVYMDKWEAEETLARVDRYRVTSTHMVPTQFKRMLMLPEPSQAPLRPVLHAVAHPRRRALPGQHQAGHAGLVGAVRVRVLRRHRGRRHVATPADWLARPGTVGCPGRSARSWWPTTRAASARPGVPGTIYMKMGAVRFVYKGDPGKTAASRRGDFFTVGDIGFLDDDGFLFLCDRKADMIISGGVNIYPAEIEAELMAHPKVADVAVFGVPDEDWGEQVKAVVQPAAGEQAGPELAAELLASLDGRLARMKWPKTVDFMRRDAQGPNRQAAEAAAARPVLGRSRPRHLTRGPDKGEHQARQGSANAPR